MPLFLDGIISITNATDHMPIEQMRLQRFDGKNWVLSGEVIGE